MEGFFKGIGKGLLNIVLIPVFIVGLAFSAVVGIGVFFLEFFKKVGKFFTGKSLSNDLPEDKQAKEMIEAAQAARQSKNDVEVVQAEIADPIASYRETAKQVAIAHAIESHEDIDFVLEDVPFQIDVDVQTEPQLIINEVPTLPDNNSEPEKIEEYKPEGSKF